MNWQFIDTGFRTGSENMDFDLQLVKELSENKIPQTLRFYQWQPNCISLGFHQTKNDLLVDKCNSDGIDIVNRPTGGKAILHANELTYSIVMDINGKSVNDVYCKISKALLCGLELIGIKAEFKKEIKDKSSLNTNQTESLSCFANTSKYEIQFNNKKLIGSAQRKFKFEKNILLQHGSIIIDKSHLEIFEYLNIDEREKEKLKNDLAHNSTSVNEILQKPVIMNELNDAMLDGFRKNIFNQFDKE